MPSKVSRDKLISTARTLLKFGNCDIPPATLVAAVKSALGLKSKKQAQHLITQVAKCLYNRKDVEEIVVKVVEAIEKTLIANLGDPDFSLKLYSFGKFTIRHKRGIYRKIPFTGETIKTSDKRKIKFVTLGNLRKEETNTNTKQ